MYSNESRQGLGMGDAVWEAPITFTSPADKAVWRVFAPITVLRIGYYVTTVMATTIPVVDFDRRITPGSDTGRVDQALGRVTGPAVATQVAGKVVYKEVRVDLNAGDEVVFELVTAAASGAAIPVMEYVARHEVPANQADMQVSTT
jgi:hypothetical protein